MHRLYPNRFECIGPNTAFPLKQRLFSMATSRRLQMFSLKRCIAHLIRYISFFIFAPFWAAIAELQLFFGNGRSVVMPAIGDGDARLPGGYQPVEVFEDFQPVDAQAQ